MGDEKIIFYFGESFSCPKKKQLPDVNKTYIIDFSKFELQDTKKKWRKSKFA